MSFGRHASRVYEILAPKKYGSGKLVSTVRDLEPADQLAVLLERTKSTLVVRRSLPGLVSLSERPKRERSTVTQRHVYSLMLTGIGLA